MRALSRLLLTSIPLALAAGCAPPYQHLVERGLTSADALTCPGFLVWNREPVRDVFLVLNGSGTGSNAFVHPSFDSLIDSRPIAYATFDKPGVRAPFGDPAAVRRDDGLFQRYTLGHGIACATEALRWARAQFGPSVRLHIRGHSEGTLIALYVYDALLDRDPDLAAGIATFVLSGLALQPFADILNHQLSVLPDGGQVRQAIDSCDRTILQRRLGISCAYIDDAVRRPSGQAMFERLAARSTSSTARFYIFQGTNDWNTPVEPVRALETWNAFEGRLPIEFHYYVGGHKGTEAAQAEMARVLKSIVSE